jgi:hypothetical protein
MPHLGRLHAPDERDHRFQLRTILGEEIVRPVSKTWRVWWKGDQGETPQCVGYSWHALLRALPYLQRDPLASQIYHEAQRVDEWPGEDYEGTSVRAGAKVLLAQGKIKHYSWSWDLKTTLDWLGTKGPVVFGTNWYDNMFDPVAGLVRIGGGVAGGHAYLAIGYDDKQQVVKFQNSWGKTWGVKGRFTIRYEGKLNA